MRERIAFKQMYKQRNKIHGRHKKESMTVLDRMIFSAFYDHNIGIVFSETGPPSTHEAD